VTPWVGVLVGVGALLVGIVIGFGVASALTASSRSAHRIEIDFELTSGGWRFKCTDPWMASAPLPTLQQARLDAARSLVAAFAAKESR
jgi:hypothetical protein